MARCVSSARHIAIPYGERCRSLVSDQRLVVQRESATPATEPRPLVFGANDAGDEPRDDRPHEKAERRRTEHMADEQRERPDGGRAGDPLDKRGE